MLKPIFKDGVPTCPCGSQEFKVAFKEVVYHNLNASKGSEGWGETEPLETTRDPIELITCANCDKLIDVTPEMEAFIRKIE